MTQDEIIRMAEEAGFSAWSIGLTKTPSILERFASLVAAAEREACAKICESLATDRGMFHPDDEELKTGVLAGAGMCGVTIRARGEK
jgi:hypothetical protein